jgi:hypothetical protein
MTKADDRKALPDINDVEGWRRWANEQLAEAEGEAAKRALIAARRKNFLLGEDA